MWENLDPNDTVSAFISVRKNLAVAVNGFPEHARCWGMDGEFQRRLANMVNVRVVLEPSVYGISLSRKEADGFFKSDKLKPGDASDGDSYRVRRGKSGGYRDYFSDEQNA